MSTYHIDLSPTIHSDGYVTYWSVYRQQWVDAWPSEILDQEYAAMSRQERGAILALDTEKGR